MLRRHGFWRARSFELAGLARRPPEPDVLGSTDCVIIFSKGAPPYPFAVHFRYSS